MPHTSIDGDGVAVTFHDPVNGKYGRIAVHSERTEAKADIDRTDRGIWLVMLHSPAYQPSCVPFHPETHQGTVSAFGVAFVTAWLDRKHDY